MAEVCSGVEKRSVLGHGHMLILGRAGLSYSLKKFSLSLLPKSRNSNTLPNMFARAGAKYKGKIKTKFVGLSTQKNLPNPEANFLHEIMDFF